MLKEKSRRAILISSRLPDIAEETIKKADMYMENKFILPGTGAKPLFAGDPIAWLDNKVGDNEYIWQLNRMTHWQSLLQAYALTKDEKYAAKVISELSEWVIACPPPKVPENFNELKQTFSGVHPWRILEVGIRAYKTFPLIMEYLEGFPAFTDNLKETYHKTMLEHAELLENVSPILWPNADHNHYLMEMLGLLSVSVIFPNEVHAPRWRDMAVRELERCNAAQLTEDGGQIEGCPMYHNGCMFWFGHSLVIAKQYGIRFSDEYISRYRKALNYSIFSLRADGSVIPWGDSTTRNNAVLAAVYGYAVFNSMEWFDALLKFSKKNDILKELTEHLWRIPDLESLLDHFDSESNCKISLPLFNWQKPLKQVFMRSDWSKSGAGLMFACRTPINNFHAHIDPMSFDYTALGKPLIVDPGIITYQNNENRYKLKSAAYHNTLTVNGRDHFEYTASFGFGPQKYGTIYDAGDLGKLKYAAAMHMEFCPAVHKRLLALYQDKFLLVLDVVDYLTKDDTVQLYYHINSTNVKCENGVCHTEDKGANVAVYYSSCLLSSIHDGIVGELVDVWHASKRLKLECSQKGSKRVYASVICPYSNSMPVCKSLSFDGESCQFKIDGEKFVFTWTADGFFGETF